MKRSLFFCILLAAMLFHADFVTEGAKNGLLLWYSSVVPALFPFMVLSGLIVTGGAVSALMRPFFLILHPLLGISEAGCYTLLCGLLCGYPMGAKTCADFVNDGRISVREGNRLMAFCNHPSPMFLLGYVYPLFCGRVPLSRFLPAVYAPVLIIAAAAKFADRPGKSDERNHNPLSAKRGQAGTGPKPLSGKRSPAERTPNPPSAKHSPAVPDGAAIRSPADAIPSAADAAILSSVEVLCKIGGYLMLYSIAIVFLRHAGFLPDRARLFLIASLEMTTGVRELAAALPLPFMGAAVCAALAFGGLSGFSQTNAVIRNCGFGGEKLSTGRYFFWKVLHAALSAAIFLLL